jgi:hypothetical protein
MKDITFETFAVTLPDSIEVHDIGLCAPVPGASRELRLAGDPVSTTVFPLGQAVATQSLDYKMSSKCDTFATGIPAVVGPVDTMDVAFQKLGLRTDTYNVPVTPPRAPEAMNVRLYETGITTYQSIALDNAFITLDMIELKYVNYPRITEFITDLAEKNNLPYSQIKLIGVYEPVPLHLAYDLKLDPVSGKLRYRLRPPGAREERQFVRIAYARVRLTDQIIYNTYPVT